MIEERILSIDYGKKRIGLALSDPLKIFSYPFKTIENDKNLWKNLATIIKEYNINSILLGYPLREDGKKSDITLTVEKFKEELESKIKLTVILWDERYSSEIAKENILQSVTSRKKRRDKSLIDRNAASVLLQEYLDTSK